MPAISRSTILHLRIPFSVYLMPVFCFAASQGGPASIGDIVVAFIIIHLFLYPASNGFNSYYDKDVESIGGLENPPPVSKELLNVSLVFDLVAILAGFYFGWAFPLMLFIYGLVSKAYSYDGIRLKKYPVISLLAAAVFQGAFTYLMVYQAIHHLSFGQLMDRQILLPASISSFMIAGFYPMTQIYQHSEDARRGDMTFSRLLGLKGTFHFSAAAFVIANAGFFYYFITFYNISYFYFFQLFLAPVYIYFLTWYLKVRKDGRHADFTHTMLLNKIASLCIAAYFISMVIVDWRS